MWPHRCWHLTSRRGCLILPLCAVTHVSAYACFSGPTRRHSDTAQTRRSPPHCNAPCRERSTTHLAAKPACDAHPGRVYVVRGRLAAAAAFGIPATYCALLNLPQSSSRRVFQHVGHPGSSRGMAYSRLPLSRASCPGVRVRAFRCCPLLFGFQRSLAPLPSGASNCNNSISFVIVQCKRKSSAVSDVFSRTYVRGPESVRGTLGRLSES